MNKYLYILVALFCLLVEIKAQDFLLSQPYNNSLTIAPSFAGITTGGRATFSYRNQWPGVSKSSIYTTYVFGLDYFSQDYNSGFGVLATNDIQGDGVIKSFDVDALYNFRAKLSRDLYFRPGIKVGINNKSIDYSRMIFSHNIAVDGSVVTNGVPFDFEIESYNKLDAGVSALLHNKNFWFGVDVDHLIQNNVSFINEDSRVPLKIDLMSGYSWIYRKKGWSNPYDETITFALLGQHQGEFNQLDIGVNWSKNPVQFGVWYRNFIIPTSTISSRDAMIFMLGFNTEEFKISYSYDLSLSGLYDSSNGAHEISLVYLFNQKEKQPIDFFCR